MAPITVVPGAVIATQTHQLPQNCGGIGRRPSFCGAVTEREGFEPSYGENPVTGFRDRHRRVPHPGGLQGFFDSGAGCGEVSGEVGLAGSSAVVPGERGALSARAG